MSIIDGNQSGKISKVYIDGILLMLCLRGPMPFLQVCTRLCRGQSCVRYALRGPLPPRIRVCGRLCRLQSLMSIKVPLSSLGRTESGPVRVFLVLPLQRSRPDVRCRRDRAEPDGKRGNAVSECGAGDSEGVEAMHFRHCVGRRGAGAMTRDADAEVCPETVEG